MSTKTVLIVYTKEKLYRELICTDVENLEKIEMNLKYYDSYMTGENLINSG